MKKTYMMPLTEEMMMLGDKMMQMAVVSDGLGVSSSIFDDYDLVE